MTPARPRGAPPGGQHAALRGPPPGWGLLDRLDGSVRRACAPTFRHHGPGEAPARAVQVQMA
ncbi:MAG TPA: hypothetical protein VE173_03960, partial [Longimicrobiales bacterium]|nr:hypothetical protein [Longimicrobiales bacterium]